MSKAVTKLKQLIFFCFSGNIEFSDFVEVVGKKFVDDDDKEKTLREAFKVTWTTRNILL